MIPQIIMLALMFFDYLAYANKHGQSKGNYNIWHYFISNIILLTLLYFGGFFDVWFK